MGKLITVEYEGKKYTINDNEVFSVVDAIEDVITVGQIATMLRDPNQIRFAKLADAYAALLSELGATVDRNKLLSQFRRELGTNAIDGVSSARDKLTELITILMDTSEIESDGAGDKEPGNAG